MTAFPEPQASFSAVTPPSSPTENGTGIDLGVIQDGFLLYIECDGTGSDQATAGFQGSLDNSTWYQLTSGSIIGGNFSVLTSSIPARYVRAFGRTTSGSPVLTASVAGAVG